MADLNTQTPIFSGESRPALDEKGRVTVPSRWRRLAEGGEEFFLTVDRTNTHIRVMPPDVFASAVQRLAGQPGIAPKDIAKFERMFYAKSRTVTTDKQGRINIPADYAAAVGIDKNVVLVGTRVSFEIYSPETWDRVQEAEAPEFERLSELAGL